MNDSTNRPGAKVMRELLDDIQTSITRGVARRAIFDKLTENGLTITYESFLVTLKRLRKEQRDSVTSLPTTESQSQSVTQQTLGKESKAIQEEQCDPSTTTSTRESQSARTDVGSAFGVPKRHATKANQYVPEDDTNPLLDQLI